MGDVGAVLRLHPVVRELDDDAIARLVGASSEVAFTDGEVLVGFGDSPDTSYVIATGEVQVLLRATHGAELVIRVIGPGMDAAAMAWIDGGTQPTEYLAVGPVTAVALPAAAFRDEMLRRPDLLLVVASRLADQIRLYAGGIADIAFLDVRRRPAKLILAVEPEDDGVVRLGANQTAAAARLGVTRQTLNRALGALTDRGWILADGGEVRVRDRASLERFVST